MKLYHDADQNQDNVIDLSEIRRIIQFYNSGGYYACPSEDTDDGFCPGVAP